MGRVGLQGPWAGLLRDTCTSQVRVGVPEAGRLPEQSGMPQVAGRHPQPWWTPEWQAFASQLQSRVLGNGGLIVAHKGDCKGLAFDVHCPEFSRLTVENTSPPPGGSLPGLACSPGGAPTLRPGRQGQRGRWRAGLGARGSLPFLGLAPHSPSEVRLVGPRVPRARGGGAGPGGASGLPLPRPQPVAGPDLPLPLVQALASSLSCFQASW